MVVLRLRPRSVGFPEIVFKTQPFTKGCLSPSLFAFAELEQPCPPLGRDCPEKQLLERAVHRGGERVVVLCVLVIAP